MNEIIKLYLFNLDSLGEEFNISYLKKEDIEKISNYKNDINKKQGIISTYFKRKYVKDYKVLKSGKPISKNKFFSISHSNKYVIYAENDKYEIGVDIEYIKEYNEKLINYICSSAEKNLIKNAEDFYKIWTSKEGLIKCFGGSITFDLKKIPAYPFDGIKEYDGNKYSSRIIKYEDYIISIVLLGDVNFEVEVINEIL